jgi:hypothetical protein
MVIHLLEGDAPYIFGITHERGFTVLSAAGVLVGDDGPIWAAVLCHRDHKRITTGGALVRFLLLKHEHASGQAPSPGKRRKSWGSGTSSGGAGVSSRISRRQMRG